MCLCVCKYRSDKFCTLSLKFECPFSWWLSRYLFWNFIMLFVRDLNYLFVRFQVSIVSPSFARTYFNATYLTQCNAVGDLIRILSAHPPLLSMRLFVCAGSAPRELKIKCPESRRDSRKKHIEEEPAFYSLYSAFLLSSSYFLLFIPNYKAV